MAKVTWLGEDHLHFTEDEKGNKVPSAGPSYTTWNGVKFAKGEAVDVTNPVALAKAKKNPFFKVEGAPGRPPKDKDGEQDAE